VSPAALDRLRRERHRVARAHAHALELSMSAHRASVELGEALAVAGGLDGGRANAIELSLERAIGSASNALQQLRGDAGKGAA